MMVNNIEALELSGHPFCNAYMCFLANVRKMKYFGSHKLY